MTVTPAEIEELEALLARPGGPEFSVLLPLKQTDYGDVDDGYGCVVVDINPWDADDLAIQRNVLRLMVAATNALPRLLAALRAQDGAVPVVVLCEKHKGLEIVPGPYCPACTHAKIIEDARGWGRQAQDAAVAAAVLAEREACAALCGRDAVDFFDRMAVGVDVERNESAGDALSAAEDAIRSRPAPDGGAAMRGEG